MSEYINEALLDASPMRKQKEEAKALVGKWEKTGLLDGLNEDFQKGGMAQLLENQARQLIGEANGVSNTNPTGGNDEEWSGVALPLVRRIFGEIAAQEFVSVQPMNLPSGLVFYLDFKYGTSQAGKTAGNSLGGTTGGETPATSRDTQGEGGLYGAGRYGYSSNNNSVSVTIGAAATSTAYATSSVNYTTDLNWDADVSASLASATSTLYKVIVASASLTNPDSKAVRAWSVTGSGIVSTLNQFTAYDSTTGNTTFIVSASGQLVGSGSETVGVQYSKQPGEATRGDFESTSGAGMPIPEVDLQLNSQAIVAKTRKLKAVWTPELAQDLNAYHSVDAEAELTSMLSEYISMEIDLEILDMLISDATTTDFWSARQGYDYVTSSANFQDNGFTGTRFEWWQTLGSKIQKVSNEIHKLTLRGGANFVVCGPKVATILESLPGYNTQSGNADTKFAMGVSKIGGIDGRFQIYKNPYMSENTILVGFRGSNFLETGAVYAPYVPLIMTPLVYDPTDFTPRKGVMTRYAKKMIRPEFYGKINCADLDLI